MPYRDHKKAAIQLPFCVSPSSSLRRFAPGRGLRRVTCCIFDRFCVSCRSPGFQQSDGFLPNPYAKPLFLHTNHPKTNHLYAKTPVLHTHPSKPTLFFFHIAFVFCPCGQIFAAFPARARGVGRLTVPTEISSLRSDISAACGGTRFRSRWSRYLGVTAGNQSAGAEEPLSVYSPNLTSINT